ncbi:MAG: DUF167 domain-containing protein [Patescibacteria group bacterium]
MKKEILEIKIITNAKKFEIIRDNEGKIFKMKILKPPVDGKANQEILQLLAKEYNTNKQNIKIIKGEKSKNKIIEIFYK